jgi:hypothetical protein
MKTLLPIAALAFLAQTTVAAAQDADADAGDAEGAAARHGPVVVELFTSQGCSACPPADAMMAELAGRDDVIALSLHVDYWNYLGWEDTFSQAAFTQRQYGYSHAAHSTVVYTPQLIIGGSHPIMPDRAMDVVEYIATHRAAPDPVALSVRPTGEGYTVEARWAEPGPAPDMVVHLVGYSPRETVEIKRGENAGRTAEYHNVVMRWQVVAEWTGARVFSAEIVPRSDLSHALIVQTAGHGAILGAARLE